MNLDDTGSLLHAARFGGPEGLPLLLERLRPRIVVWAAGRMSPLLRSKVEPEDVAQEILLAVHQDIATFRGKTEAEFFAWLFTLAANRIRDLADHHGALKRQLPSPHSFSQTSPSQAAARNEEIGRMRAAISELSESHREAILLVRIENLGVTKAAERLGRSENAVRILYCRALKELRERLGAPGTLP